MKSSRTEPRRRVVLYLITSVVSARFLEGQLRHVITAGFSVDVGTNVLSKLPARFDEGVQVHHIDYSREPSPLHDLRALAQTVRLIIQLRPQVVNASTPKAGLLGILGGWTCRVPQRVYLVRGLRFETTTGVRRAALRLLERLTMSCATVVVFNSPSLRSLAERERIIKPNRGRLLGVGSGNGIDLDRFNDLPSREYARARLGLSDFDYVIGYVGRLTRDKGIVDLARAFERVPSRTCVLLVGDYEPGDSVPAATRQLIEALPHMVHREWAEGDLPAIYRALNVLVFPSYREGLPNVPLEAQLCEVPVVAYAATGTTDAVKPGVGGILVPVGDIDALRDTTLELLARPDARLNGREFVVRAFDQRKLWTALVSIYEGGAEHVDEPEPARVRLRRD